MNALTPEELPDELDATRRAILVDLGRLWLRLSDYRFGQMLRTASNRPIPHPTSLTDQVVREGLVSALERFAERPLPAGPYWDTETKGQGSFLKGRPRDPARIAPLLVAFADAWVRYPHLWFGQVLDFALDRAGITDTEYGTRWLLLEDGPIRRALKTLADDPDDPVAATRSGARQRTGPQEAELAQLMAAMRDSRGGVVLDPERFHDWIVGHGDLVWSGIPQATPRRRSPVARLAPVIAIHAGARGGIEQPRVRQHYQAMLENALSNGRLMLENEQDAVHVVRTVLWIMESLEFGYLYLGAPLCSDGSARLSAAIMRGRDRAAGAVAGLRHTKHPILAARLMLNSEDVMLVGGHADGHAAYHRHEQAANSYFINDRQQAKLAAGGHQRDDATIGAVCLDARGHLAAGTVTGGFTGQPPGRVGAAALIGAGTWADRSVAVSCGGDGEALIRSGTARLIATLVGCGTELDQAVQMAIADLERLGGLGGLIAVSSDGEVAMAFNTLGMYRGVWRKGGEPTVSSGPDATTTEHNRTDADGVADA